MYEIRLLEEASENLAELDKPIAKRIYRKLMWLAENAAVVARKGLRKGLSGLSSFENAIIGLYMRSITKRRS